MRRRQQVVVVPPELLKFAVADWPDTTSEFGAVSAWSAERDAFEQEHPGALAAAVS